MFRLLLNKLFWGFFRHILSDRQYAKARFWLSTGRKLNIDQPETFSDKINWLKLYDRTELRKRVADRVEVREFVSERIGEDHLIPLKGVYDEFGMDEWESLPDQFVLKANHGSGMIKIVRDKNQENPEEVIELVKKWQSTDYSKFGREWIYRDLDRVIVAEQLLLSDEGEVPEDYKFFCYHGRVQIFQIDFDRYGNHQRNFYDRNCYPLDVAILHPNNPGEVERHKMLDEAFELAESLSQGFNFVRVDLYLHKNKVYFGEMTNFPGNGYEPFEPVHYDLHFGSLLKL